MTLRSGNKYARSKASDFMDDENSDDVDDTFVTNNTKITELSPEYVRDLPEIDLLTVSQTIDEARILSNKVKEI